MIRKYHLTFAAEMLAAAVGYAISAEWCNRRQLFFTSITYEGTAVDELTADFHGAVGDYLQLCKEKGITINAFIKNVVARALGMVL